MPTLPPTLPDIATDPTTAALEPRPARDADWPAICAGFAHAFTDARSPQVWDWRFQRHLGAAGSACWVTPAPDGSIAAFVGASRHRGWLDGQDCNIWIGRDNYSHPRWRGSNAGRRGWYARTDAAFLQASATQATLCLGFGLARRVRLGQRLGISQPLTSGQWLACPVLPSDDSPGCAVLLQPARFADPTWDAFWQQRRPHIRAGICRDAAFLSWRFDPRQGVDYHCLGIHSLQQDAPLGYLVWRVLPAALDSPPALRHTGLQAVLVDAALPPHHAQHAWAQALCVLRRLGVAQVLTFSTPGTPEHAQWPLLGFRPCPPPVDSQPLFRSFSPHLPAERLEAQYALTLADGDLF